MFYIIMCVGLGITGFVGFIWLVISIIESNRKKWPIIILGTALVFFVGIQILNFTGIHPSYYQPKVTGKIIELYYGGNFWETHEGILTRLGVTTDGNGHYTTNTVPFTIVNEEHVKILKQAQLENKRVIIELNTYFLRPYKYNSANIVQSVIIMDD